MAVIRKLGRTTDHRLAMLKNQVTQVIWHGQIVTTEQKAKEVKSLVDSLMSLAVKEKDNYEMVEKKVSRAKVDENGRKVTEVATSKNGKKFDKVVREEVTETVKQDKPSRLAVRRTLIKNLNKVRDEEGNTVDLPGKMLNELAEKYGVKISACAIMPNHIHLILMMNGSGVTAGRFVGAFKSVVSNRWQKICDSRGIAMGKLWQRDFYYHILRNEANYLEKLKYIDENPDKWQQVELFCD